MFLWENTGEGEVGGVKFTYGTTIPEGSIVVYFPDATYVVGMRSVIDEIMALRGKTIAG